MKAIDSKAIVISSLKYGDSSLIVRLYTEKVGLTSFLVRGVLNSKKSKIRVAYFQPLNLLRVTFHFNPKKGLQTLKEVYVNTFFKTIPRDIAKQSIVLFLSEILSNCIQEEESNIELFDYLENTFIWLDTHSKIANFHFLFLLNLSKFLGFYPDTKNSNFEYFDFTAGEFLQYPYNKEFISGKEIILLKRLLGTNFATLESLSFSSMEKQNLMQILIRYYELHLHGFKKPKSVSVLEAVFSK